MEKHYITIWIWISVLIILTIVARAQQPEPGDIFSDDFDPPVANKWLDMKVWGFGVWQIRDGVMVSIDSSNLSQQLYSALPKFDNAIVNRDYTVLFRYQPISGENYSFTIDMRPQGWNNYKLEIAKDGTLRILKNLAGKLPQALFISVPGQIFFAEWQWVRLEVTGEKPVCFKIKIWQGTLSDEPEFYHAIAVDPKPLQPQNMNFALTSFQSGGAYTMIDDFNIYRHRLRTDSSAKARIRPDNEKLREAIFSESEKNELQELLKELAFIQNGIEHLKLMPSPLPEINDRANLEVELFALQNRLNDCTSPDHFQFYRETIQNGISRAKSHLIALRENQQPFHHRIGTFMRGYYSEIDANLQGYALFAPDTYDGQTPFPLVINLHGYDPSFSGWQENLFLPVFMPHATAKGRYILVNPFGRGNTMYQNIGEQDVLAVLAEVQRLYAIDANRIYLTGGSMGGAGTWWLGLSYPDRFAAMAPIMGPTEFTFWNNPISHDTPSFRRFITDRMSALALAENALNLPVFCNHGVLDDIVPVEQSRQMVKRFSELGYEIKYVEHPEAAHGGFKPEMDYEIYDWFENLRRNPFPKKVVYKTGSLKHPGAYWVKIDRFLNLLKFATIEAEITSANAIEVKTENVAEFSLTFSDALIEANLPVKISVDEQVIVNNVITDPQKITFAARSASPGRITSWIETDSRNESRLAKHQKLAGPIQDAYNSGFILVYGTIGAASETRINKQQTEGFSEQWRSWQHAYCRIKSDVEVTAEDIARFNLILFGNANSNSILNKVNASLPIRFEGKAIVAGKNRFSGAEVGLAMIYPNPLNQNRYVVIQAGISGRGTTDIIKRIGTEFDYLIFDDRTLGINVRQGNLTIDGTPLLCGFFDQDWQIDEHYQWRGNQQVRNQIKPRQVYRQIKSESKKSFIYLSAVQPDSIHQWTGVPEPDRNFWGYPFQIDGRKHEKGIGVFPNSELIYWLDGAWDQFTAIVSADLNPFSNLKKEQYKGGKIQFGIYGDGAELFVSRVLDVNSEPQSIAFPISGIKELKLVVRTQDWLPYFAQSGSWIEAKLVR